MWTILKYDKKKYHFLKIDFLKKLGNDFIFYQPKIKIQKINKNKLRKIEFDILGNYIFCFHKNFQNIDKTINYLKYCRGLKYFLNGCGQSQNEIKKFINKCKTLEDDQGFISETLFELNKNSSYKFSNGPFVEKIFKIIDFQKNKINILLGEVKTTINKKDFLFSPI